jgi:hypothetical protein
MRRTGHTSPKIKLAVKFRPVITGRNLTAAGCGGERGATDSAIAVPSAIFQPISIRNGTSWNNPETTCYY